MHNPNNKESTLYSLCNVLMIIRGGMINHQHVGGKVSEKIGPLICACSQLESTADLVAIDTLTPLQIRLFSVMVTDFIVSSSSNNLEALFRKPLKTYYIIAVETIGAEFMLIHRDRGFNLRSGRSFFSKLHWYGTRPAWLAIHAQPCRPIMSIICKVWLQWPHVHLNHFKFGICTLFYYVEVER